MKGKSLASIVLGASLLSCNPRYVHIEDAWMNTEQGLIKANDSNLYQQ